MDSKFIKVQFSFSVLYGLNGPSQELGVLFDVKYFPEPLSPQIKIRSIGFCGMDVQRYLSASQISAIMESCRCSLDNGIKAVDNDAPTRDNVDTSQLHSDFS